MKKVLNCVLATLILASLTACVVVPPHAEYVGPRYYGEPEHHHHHDRDWDRRW